jgi:tetratricopeptide (TPR) repeat protein
MKHWTLLILLAVLYFESAIAQNERRALMDANETYRQQKFEDAETRYKNANPGNQRLKEIAAFNLADAQYRLGKFDEAAEGFGKIAMESENKDLQVKAYHNEGNSYIAKKDYGKAVESYKNALRLNPEAEDTRYNLAYARKMIQKQQQQEQQQNQDKNKEGDEKKDQQKGDQDEQKENEGNEKNEPKPGDKEGKEEISKEDAERILKALENAESDLQKKLRKPEGTAKKKKIEKDW